MHFRRTCMLSSTIMLASLWLLIEPATVLAQGGGSQVTVSTADQERINELHNKIRGLRTEAAFSETVPLAEELHTILKRNRGESSTQAKRSAELVEELKHIASLPQEQQKELAEAEKGDAQVQKHFRDGEYAEALAIAEKHLQPRRRILGDEHPKTLDSLNNIAVLLKRLGRFVEAEPRYQEVLKIRRRVHGEEHSATLTAASNLYKLFEAQGKYQEAEELLRQALTVRKRLSGEENRRTVLSMENLAGLLWLQGKSIEAEPLLRQIVEIRKRTLEDYHPARLKSITNLAVVLQDQGKRPEAENLYREMLEARRDILGELHPHVLVTMNHLAALLLSCGETAPAAEILAKAAEQFEEIGSLLTRAIIEQVSFAPVRSPLPLLAACLARAGKTRQAWQSLEAHFAGALFDGRTAWQLRPITAEERASEGELAKQLVVLDTHLLKLMMGEMTDEWRDEIKWYLKRRKGPADKILNMHKELRGKYGAAAGVRFDLDRIQKQLPADTALLAWLDLNGNPSAPSSGGEHWACVLRKQGDPTWVKLPGSGAQKQWTRADDDVRRNLAKWLATPPAGVDAKSAALEALYKQRLAPVEAHLEGVSHLIILPAGWMAGIPIDALTDRYSVSAATSGTLHAWLRERQPQTSKMFLGLADGLASRQQEVQAIAKLLSDGLLEDDTKKPKLLLGADASERQLHELAESGELEKYRFIHLAAPGAMNDDEVLMSALHLSRDATSRDSSDGGSFDGRLTPDEIVRGWKLNADLVTLSACETPFARRSEGEGVLGFAQALLVSGARSVVMSLWKTDQTATALLMHRFYENLLGKRGNSAAMSKAAALTQAKKWLQGLSRSDAREACRNINLEAGGRLLAEQEEGGTKAPYVHPHYWAGFILIGDPN